jgi:hypothetical protein
LYLKFSIISLPGTGMRAKEDAVREIIFWYMELEKGELK